MDGESEVLLSFFIGGWNILAVIMPKNIPTLVCGYIQLNN